jgi:hypothetical protein
VQLVCGDPVDLTEVEALVDLYEQPLLAPKPKGNGHAAAIDEPDADEHLTVTERLERMQYQGSGNTGVHLTCLSVSATLLLQGQDADMIADGLLEAVQRVTAEVPECAGWDWDEERRTIERMCFDFINKRAAEKPDLIDQLPEGLRDSCNRRREADHEHIRVSFFPHCGWRVTSRPPAQGETLAGLSASMPPPRDAGDARVKAQANGHAPSAQCTITEPPKRRFPLIAFYDLQPGTDVLYLVDELLPAKGIGMIWGKFKTLKSFFVFELALHVALGWSYHDRYVQQGSVVYCAFEGAHGFRNRAEAWRRYHKVTPETHPDIPLLLMPYPTNLVKEAKTLMQDIRSQLRPDERPALIILDTLNKSLHGSESSDEDMSNYVRAAAEIRTQFDCLVLIIHHCGWDESRPRGHTSLPGAIDVQIAITREEMFCTATVELMKDGAEGGVVQLRAEKVVLGSDAISSEDITSLVMVAADGYHAAEFSPTSGKRGRPDAASPTFYKALTEALGEQPIVLAVGPNKMSAHATTLDAVRQKFHRYFVDGEPDKKKSAEAERKAFARCLVRLVSDRVVGTMRNDKDVELIWRIIAKD